MNRMQTHLEMRLELHLARVRLEFGEEKLRDRFFV